MMGRKPLLELAWLMRLILVIAALVNGYIRHFDAAIFLMLVAIYLQLGDRY